MKNEESNKFEKIREIKEHYEKSIENKTIKKEFLNKKRD